MTIKIKKAPLFMRRRGWGKSNLTTPEGGGQRIFDLSKKGGNIIYLIDFAKVSEIQFLYDLKVFWILSICERPKASLGDGFLGSWSLFYFLFFGVDRCHS